MLGGRRDSDNGAPSGDQNQKAEAPEPENPQEDDLPF
jgi:hypothetical protein